MRPQVRSLSLGPTLHISFDIKLMCSVFSGEIKQTSSLSIISQTDIDGYQTERYNIHIINLLSVREDIFLKPERLTGFSAYFSEAESAMRS